jgi:hypothetical protein
VKENEIQDELASIRSLMERSSKFISLSGLSGILAGIYALIGAGMAYYLIYITSQSPDNSFLHHLDRGLLVASLLGIAFLVLFASVVTGIVLTTRKAKRNNQPVWGKTSRALAYYMAVPLISGGLFILILLLRGYYGIISPMSLIFYGLALISASNFTFTDVKYLGILEIILGLISACLPGYGLLFWAIGFGVLHIIYGSMMYFKYDR